MNTVKKEVGHGFSQFRLTQYLLNNLSQFKITPTAKLVLLYLSSCYNPKKADMFPKQRTIAAKTGISERSVVRAIQELIKAGLLIVECKYSNRYKFTSQIVSKYPENDFSLCPEKLSDDLSQNDIHKDDKLAEPCIEPIKEHKIEPSELRAKVFSLEETKFLKRQTVDPLNASEATYVEDYKILKQYAELKNAKNPKAYIDALRRNGAAQKIIEEAKAKQKTAKAAIKAVKETRELIVNYNQLTGVSPKENKAIMEVLRKYRQ